MSLDPPKPVLEARGVEVRYAGARGRAALQGFDVDIVPGRLTGLIGPDGAGKSTAIRALCGLIRPSAGSMLLTGRPISESRERLSSLIGYMPQRFSLYTDLTIHENIAFFARIHGRRLDRERRDGLLARMGLGGFGSRLAGRLSGGMKQKLALLCVLVHEPSLIIMDEPTTGVDPVSRREFWKILGELAAGGMAILTATPYLDEAERCHEVILMHEGRAILRGDPEEMVRGLGRPVFAIAAQGNAFRLRQAVGVLDWVRSVQVFGGLLHLVSADPSDGADDVERRLAAHGIDVRATAIRPTLEDVFIDRVTG